MPTVPMGRVAGEEPMMRMRQAYGGVTPEEASGVLARLERGYPQAWVDLTRHMLKTDGHLDDRYERMRFAVAGAPWEIEPGEGLDTGLAQAGADLCRIALRHTDDLAGTFQDMLEAEGLGYFFHEIEWTWTDSEMGMAYLPTLWPYEPRRFRFVGHYTPILYDGGLLNIGLDPQRWLIHYGRSRAGYPLETGKLLGCLWPWLLKAWGWKFWSAASERFGVPMLIGHVPIGTSDAIVQSLQRKLEQVGALHAAVLKGADTKVEIIQPAAASTADLFSKQIEMLNLEISKALGDTSADTSTTGDADNAREQRVERAELYAANLSATLRMQLFKTLLIFNRHLFGGRVPSLPTLSFRIGQERRPIPQSLIDIGGVTIDEVRRSAGLPPWGGAEGRRRTGPSSVSMPSTQPAQPAQPAQPNQPRQPEQPSEALGN